MIFKRFTILKFIYVVIFPIYLIASDLNENMNLVHSKTAKQKTPEFISNELISHLDELANPNIKMHQKIKISKNINQEIFINLPILSQNSLLLNSVINHPQYKHVIQYVNATTSNLEYAAQQYFKNLYEQDYNIESIDFFPKNDGDQTGEIMKLSLKKGEKVFSINYYIKTHQNGSRGGRSSNADIDPKEIFIYKLLELLKIGPKSHFFTSSLSHGGVYIATQDAAFSKREEKQKHKSFKVFEYYSQSLHKQLNINSGNKEDLTTGQQLAIKDNTVLIKGLATCDLISRIFRLTDVTTNLSNYGFTEDNSKDIPQIKKLKIIDFRIVNEATYSPDGLFKGFLEGNGRFNYIFNKIIGYTLKQRSIEQRIETAKVIINEFDKNNFLQDSISAALTFTQDFFVNSALDNPQNLMKEDLQRYTSEVFNNFLEFKKNLNFY